MFFKDTCHKNRFIKLRKEKIVTCYSSNNFIAAVFILSADRRMWTKCHYAIYHNKIDFEYINISDLKSTETELYTLYKFAKMFYFNESIFKISDFCDGEYISDKDFKLLLNALSINRKGLAAIKP